MPGSAEQAQTSLLGKPLFGSSRLIPIRAFALRAYSRLILYVAWYPFVLAPFAAKAPSFNLNFCHGPIYLENNIPVKYDFACGICTYVVIYSAVVNDCRRLLWKNAKLKHSRSPLNQNL